MSSQMHRRNANTVGFSNNLWWSIKPNRNDFGLSIEF